MMVIQGNLSETERRALFDDNTLNGPAVAIFPADRCVWEYADYDPLGYGYDIQRAAVITHDREYLIGEPRLGYIGKSGRFVEIAG